MVSYPAATLRCYWLLRCCWDPAPPGTGGKDGRYHLRTPRFRHRCPAREPHTPPRTQSVPAVGDTGSTFRGQDAAGVCVRVHGWSTCWDKMVTASLCLASRKLTPLTARMASPTCRPPHRSAGWLTWISEIRMGTPCSLPPW